MAQRRGCYPGSFDPLTVAHLAIAEAAREQCDLDRVDLVLSTNALGKHGHRHSLDERRDTIAAATRDHPWVGVRVTDKQLVADIAAGYDVVILGADKWAQLTDFAFYGSEEARDVALARLPQVACAPRPGFDVPAHAVVLRVPRWIGEVSSTAVRAGADHWRASARTRQSPE